MGNAWGASFGVSWGVSWGSASPSPPTPIPTPSGGGGSGRFPRGPWRIDYLEDYIQPSQPIPLPAVKQPPRKRKSVNLASPVVTPVDLLKSLGVAIPTYQEPEPEYQPPALIAAKPREFRPNLDLLVQQYRARMAELERIERARKIKQQNAAAFMLLM